jgi:hypothetical protein
MPPVSRVVMTNDKIAQPQNRRAILLSALAALAISVTYSKYAPSFAALAALTCTICRSLSVCLQPEAFALTRKSLFL